MAIEVAAWNIQGGLAIARDYRALRLVEAIQGLDKDVVVLSDAYWLDNPLHGATPTVAEQALEILETDALEQEGYTTIEVDYDDGGLWEGHCLQVLSRLAFSRLGITRLGERKAANLEIVDPATGTAVNLIGAHFSDQSEPLRLAAVDDLIESADLSRPTVLAGDLNAMPGNSLRAWLLRNKVTRDVAAKLPHRKPFVTDEEPFLENVPTIPERLCDMASGETLRRLEEAGLYNTNHGSKPTMPTRHPIFQLDYILKTKHLDSSDFKVHELPPHYARLSDHRPISVRLET